MHAEKHNWPLWLLIAWSQRNTREIKGVGHHPNVTLSAVMIGRPDITDDETAWCATWVGGCLERSGIKSTGSAMAKSYLKFGRGLSSDEQIPAGAIGVQNRTNNPAFGHVGFVLEDLGDKVRFISGNVSNRVTIDIRNKRDFVAFRVPTDPVKWGNFDVCFMRTVNTEGQFSDHPRDPGGPTYRGILSREFALWRGYVDDWESAKARERDPTIIAELEQLTVEELKAIYAVNYWFKSFADRLPLPVASMHFDCAVNQGIGDARKFIQYAAGLSGKQLDGVLGPQSLQAVLRTDPLRAITRYSEARWEDYKRTRNFDVFGNGWRNRLTKIFDQAKMDVMSGTIDELFQTSANQVPVAKHQPSAPVADNPWQDSVLSDGTNQHSRTETAPPTKPQFGTPPKWWGRSLTVWGVIISTLSTVGPFLFPVLNAMGVPISMELLTIVDEFVRNGHGILGQVIGAGMAIYGRLRATQPLTRSQPVAFRI